MNTKEYFLALILSAFCFAVLFATKSCVIEVEKIDAVRYTEVMKYQALLESAKTDRVKFEQGLNRLKFEQGGLRGKNILSR